MIFERHFEDKELADNSNNESGTQQSLQKSSQFEEEVKKEDLSSSSSINQPNSDTCSIDAEPFQFLDSPKVAPSSNILAKDKKKEQKVAEDDIVRNPKSAKGPNKDKPIN